MAAAPSRCLLVTGEVRESGERVGFEVVTLDGRSGPLASSKVSSPESVRWPTVGKYKVDVVKEETDLFIIDEVGKMELFSSAFFPAVMRVIESNIPVLPQYQFLDMAETFQESSGYRIGVNRGGGARESEQDGAGAA
ncbi:hypothetical protein PR202_gb18474 [Eleusine coracana subsp. coracana]|uniref:Uncharacterized protein n=1 Tax=Eleusine coracana subsp. coracana TaxID=191504 RepID=A0AAV5F5H3_ELECO|nr:hypothetical protein PR202_gb18474 [Eleusine coracana subsp. coracana]